MYSYDDEDWDEMIDEAAGLVLDTGKCSASLIQRRLKLGYARAARLIDQLEKLGVVGPADGAKPRKVLTTKEDYKKVDKPITQKQPIEPKPALAWHKLKPKQIDNKHLADYLAQAKDFDILLGRLSNDESLLLNMKEIGNLIISGTQYTGLSKLINQILLAAVAKWSEEELRLIMIDATANELIFPSGTGHILTPMIIDSDKAVSALKWAVSEQENRMKLSKMGSIENFPNILIVIHGLNHLFVLNQYELIDNLVRLQRFGRAVGIYLILTMDYISFTDFREIIAGNPARIAFKPVDDRFKERNLPQVAELKSPDEAILWSMYQENKKFEVLNLRSRRIYKQIFKK